MCWQQQEETLQRVLLSALGQVQVPVGTALGLKVSAFLTQGRQERHLREEPSQGLHPCVVREPLRWAALGSRKHLFTSYWVPAAASLCLTFPWLFSALPDLGHHKVGSSLSSSQRLDPPSCGQTQTMRSECPRPCAPHRCESSIHKTCWILFQAQLVASSCYCGDALASQVGTSGLKNQGIVLVL